MNDRDTRVTRAVRLALMCAAACTCVDAQAQSTGKSTGLEEIIVTAKRRNEDIQTASISATVLPQDLLESKGVGDLYSLQYAAPAITVTQYGSANVFNIRGLGRSQVDIDVPSGVVIYRDGAPTLAGYFQNEPYFDMESVEVFRGPQGTFVGKNAAGGAVFINTRVPELDKTYASLEGGVGNYNAYEGTLIANVPLGDTAAVRFGYKHYERDDFYDSITGDYTGHPGEVDNNSFRLSGLWKPNDQFQGILKVDYHDLDFGGNPTTVYGEDPLGDVEQNSEFQYTDESLRAVLSLRYEFANDVTLTSLTGYQNVDSVNNLDANATVPAYYDFHSKINAKIYSEEVNLISPDDERFNWVLGAFWQYQDNEIPYWQDGGFNFYGGGFGFAPDYPWATSPWANKEKEWAAFAHGGFHFTPSVELEAGVRYGEYKRDQFTEWLLDFTSGGLAPPTVSWTNNPGGDRQSISEDSVDWQVALNWDVNDDQFLYGVVSRGHVTGGINIFPPFIIYDEMEVINYEAGWKSSWADNQFHTQLSVYYEDFDNYQANFAEVVGALNFPTNRNAETKSHVWGIELSGQARVGGFSLDFGMAYSQSELGDFSDVVEPVWPGDLDGDGNLDGGTVVNLSGASIPFQPEFTGNVGVAYDFQIGSFTLTPRVDYSHQDETQAALWDSPWVTLEARDLVNAQITLKPESDKWSAVLWSTNLTNEEYIAGIQNNATLYYAAPPGQYGLRFKYNFGQ